MPTAQGLVHVFTDDQAGAHATMLAARGYMVLSHAGADGLFEGFDAEGACCLLVDFARGADALALLRTLAERRLAGRAILIVERGDVRGAVAAMKLGAADIAERPCDEADLAGLVAAQMAGGEGADDSRRARALIAKLSPREAEVLALLRDGKQNKAIAFSLGLSTRTVEMHRASLMQKLDARSLSDALRIAFNAAA